MSGKDTPASAESSQPQAGAENQRTHSDAGSSESAFKERLQRLKAKHQQSLEEAVAQARQEAVERFREEHGLDDESLQAIVQKDKHAAELRALRTEATKAKTAAEEHQKRSERLFGHVDRSLRKNAIIAAAVAANSNDPELVEAALASRVRVVERDSELAVEVLDERGEPTDKDVPTLVKEFLAGKPHLIQARGIFQGSGSHGSEPSAARSAGAGGNEWWRTREGRIAHLQEGLKKIAP